ncbi:MAG: hypothetical protein KGL39_54305 [Patescibacteria group bacterium]|nr:hypothetical protein [Patescibacteria group bacterium]
MTDLEQMMAEQHAEILTLRGDNATLRAQRDAANARLAAIDAATQGDAVENVMKLADRYVNDSVALVKGFPLNEPGARRNELRDAVAALVAWTERAEEALCDVADEVTGSQGETWVQWSRHRKVIAAACRRVCGRARRSTTC